MMYFGMHPFLIHCKHCTVWKLSLQCEWCPLKVCSAVALSSVLGKISFSNSCIISSSLFYLFSFFGILASQNNSLIFLFLSSLIFLHIAFCYAFWEIPSTLAFNFSVEFFFFKKLFIILNFQGLFSELIVPLLFLITCCSYFMDVIVESLYEDIIVCVPF